MNQLSHASPDDAPIVVDTGPSPRFALIWLHGLGADGSDFVPVVPELGLPPDLPGRFIFPHAPFMAVTCNGGYVMRAWYDILALEPERREVDEASLARSVAWLRGLIAAQVAAGIPSRRIFIAGFSQGGALAYTAALSHPEPLGGLIALSTYLPLPGQVEAAWAAGDEANRQLPLFAAHGSADTVVSPALGRQAYDWAAARGLPADWHSYPMEHSVCLEEIGDIGRWLGRRLQA